MKRRFTIMLEQETIKKIKNIPLKPVALREFLEWNLNNISKSEKLLIEDWIREEINEK